MTLKGSTGTKLLNSLSSKLGEFQHLVRSILDEIFGINNFVSIISYTTTSGFTSNKLSRAGDYILWYAKDEKKAKYRQLFTEKADPLDDAKTKGSIGESRG